MARGTKLSALRKHKCIIYISFFCGALLHIWLLSVGCSYLMTYLDFSNPESPLYVPSTTNTVIHSLPQMSADIEQYESSSFYLCDILYRSHVLMGAHHKTGTMLFLYSFARKGLTSTLRSKCVSNDDDSWNRIQTNYHLDKYAIDRFLSDSISSIKRSISKSSPSSSSLNLNLNLNRLQSHIVILNIVRHPVDTILSAYNYHLKGPELWTRTAIDEISSIPPKYDNGPSLQCSQRILTQLMRDYDIATNQGYSLQTLYSNILDLTQGIGFEYQRYAQCCFEEIESSYDRIQSLKNRDGDEWSEWNIKLHLETFRTEDFVSDFNGTCDRLMDKIGIIEKDDRVEFMNGFQAFDIGRDSAGIRKRGKQHVTNGTFNKTEQIGILLGDGQRCSEIKDYTMKLDYSWEYIEYC